MMDGMHRILAGNPDRRIELVAAGVFVAVWFLIDVMQFTDFVWQKFYPSPVVCVR